MTPTNWQEWVAWAGLALPLATLALSALLYVLNMRRQANDADFERFFSIMDKVGQREGSILAKVAAIYELRGFPRYRDLIIRMCNDAQGQVVGDSAHMLVEEFRLTAEYMRNGGV